MAAAMVASTHSRWLALLILVCGSFGCTGCSLIGLGIGASNPTWNRGVPAEDLAWHQEMGEPLDVSVEVSGARGAAVGSYVGLTGKELIVMTAKGQRQIPLRDIERVDVRTGSHWATGLGVGFVIDLTVAVILGIVAASMTRLNFGGFSSSM